MTTADIVSLAAFALGAWVTGFYMGFLITAFRKFADKI